MKAGELNKLIEIVRSQEQTDGAGGTIPSVPVTVAKPWAKVVYLKASKELKANQEALKPTAAFTLRTAPGYPQSQDVIKYDGHSFGILSIVPNSDRTVTVTAEAIQIP